MIEPLFMEQGGGIFGRGGAVKSMLSSSIPLKAERCFVRSRFTLHAGQIATFAMAHALSSDVTPSFMTPEEIMSSFNNTARAWESWSDLHQNYQGPWKELVHQSGRVLQGLTFYPTGAIVAAPTTSLPESRGGSRNWDYRFTWVRDASLTLEALWVAACPDEADKFFDYLTGVAATQIRSGQDLQIMFGIGGEHDLTEREIPHLSGWCNSYPVRVGNAAWSQRQIDIYGELMGAVYRLQDRLTQLHPITLGFLADVADSAIARWTQKDQGIWEIRGEPADFLYSKLMCWVAVDRAIQMANLLNAQDRVPRWQEARDEMRHKILEQGWNERVGAFTQAFGTDTLDASNLMIPIVGFLPATDPRVLSTIRAIERNLRDPRGLVYRYRSEDGLKGEEGSFLLCTFWLAQAQALAGKLNSAKETFNTAVSFANDVGLLSEEVEPSSGELLGNFPQAFSHIGLINAAWVISEAEGGSRPDELEEKPLRRGA
jgi:GH15 family glucan-1,4-alpha-glucosidase